MSDRADIVVVGAGVMGASIAYHLVERGAGDVLVLERRRVAAGASGRSSALVRLHYTFAPEVRLAVESLAYFEEWTERLGRPGHFRKTGFVYLVPRDEEDRLRANVRMQQELGARTRLVDRAELAELEPAWRFDDVDVAAYEPDSGYGDGATVATDFLDRARELGARYRPDTAVRALRAEGGRIAAVVTDTDVVETRTVVVATGAWSAPLLETVGVRLPLETEYHEVAILERPAALARPHLACIDAIHCIYFRSEGTRQTLVGDFYGERGHDPDAERSPSLEAMEARLEKLARRIPAMADAGIVRTVSGTYTMSPDARGLMGPIRAVEGLYCCTGFSGMGFKISPAVGRAMAELIVDGRASTVDIAPFYPDRFADGRPIRPPNEYRDV